MAGLAQSLLYALDVQDSLLFLFLSIFTFASICFLHLVQAIVLQIAIKCFFLLFFQEEHRARDLFYALWVPDLFMERVQNNGLWSLFCPNEAPGLADCWGQEFVDLYTRYEREVIILILFVTL